MKIFIATKNHNKLKELERILKPMGFEVLSENDLEKPLPEVEETGTTYEENALLKAHSGLKEMCIRDSGSVFFAGQLSGVEGYMESAASGIIAGINAAALLKDEKPLILPEFTMIGALLNYICDESVADFQPMGANFGICLLYTSRCV